MSDLIHSINNDLMAIRALVAVARLTARSGEDISRQLDAIESMTERIATTISQSSPAKSEGETEESSESPCSIVIADDDVRIRELLARVLSADGHTVHLAADGDEAIRLALHAGVDPDVIILDQNLPLRRGSDCAEVILEEASDVSIILTSGRRCESMTTLADRIQFLSKPFSSSDLRRSVASAVSGGVR